MKRIFFWFGLFMSFLYVFLGAAMLGSRFFSELVDGTTRIVLGIILTVYGFFRGYMHFKNRGK